MASSERKLIRTVTNGKLYSDGTVLVMNCIWSYPNVLYRFGERPGQSADDDDEDKGVAGKFSLQGLMKKTTHAAVHKMLRGEIDKILAEKKVKLPPDRLFLKDGDQTVKDEYLGNWFVAASESRTPFARGPDGRSKLTKRDASKIFGGVRGHILIRPWWQDHKKYGKRINAGLAGVQLIQWEGDEIVAFGNGPRIDEDDINETFENEATDTDWTTDGVDDDLDDL